MKIELSNGVVVIPTPEITLKIKEILFDQEIVENSAPAEKLPETKTSQKYRRKFEEKSEKKIKRAYSEEQEANIIAMCERGMGAKEIARKFPGKTVGTIYAKIAALKKQGRIKQAEPPDSEEDKDDGFKNFPESE